LKTHPTSISLKLFLIFSSCLLLSQCGNSDQTGVTIQIAPKSPILFTVGTDITLTTPTPSASASSDLTTVTLGADWFGANYTFINNNSVPITFVSVTATFSGTVKGIATTSSVTLGPSDINYFTTLTFIAASDSNSTSTVIANHTSQPLLFYIQGIESDFDSTSISVTLEFDGYYGDQTNPLDRLTKIIYFSTQ
jgi:hypothetical protein